MVFKAFASSNNTFFTTIIWTFFGIKDWSSFVVIQAPALVFTASFLYLIESKKVKSLFLAEDKGLTLSIWKLFLKLNDGKIFFNLVFFFDKEIWTHSNLFETYWF